jgi:hypothetical protein
MILIICATITLSCCSKKANLYDHDPYYYVNYSHHMSEYCKQKPANSCYLLLHTCRAFYTADSLGHNTESRKAILKSLSIVQRHNIRKHYAISVTSMGNRNKFYQLACHQLIIKSGANRMKLNDEKKSIL